MGCGPGAAPIQGGPGGKRGTEAPKSKSKDEEGGVPLLDIMELNLGYGLIPLVDPEQKGELVDRIRTVRRQFASEMGIVIPPVHIKDSPQIDPNKYSILIKGAEVAGGAVMVDRYLALNPGGVDKGIQGIATREPSFGLPALWISPQDKERAELAGFTVVDPSTMIATHLTEVIRSYSHELIGRQEIQSLLDSFAKRYPKVVEELVPNLLPLGVVVRVLQNLLKERVAISDLLTILETLGGC